MILLELFFSFFKIGAFTFGGGYAMLPLIQEEALRRGWMDVEELMNFVAVSESTPGPLAVNLSTYVGAETAGLLGALCATLGLVMPSFLIILAIAKFFSAFQESVWVKGCMDGLRPAAVGMVASAFWSVLPATFPMWASWPQLAAAGVLAVGAYACHCKKVHPILIILGCAGIGMALGSLGVLSL